MRFAIEIGLRTDDPTTLIKPVKKASEDGFHEWSEIEVEKFEKRHPIGTRARLAFDLLLYTGQRRSDMVRMGPADVRDGFIHVVQSKTGTSLQIPILPALSASLAAFPTEDGPWLATERGKPFDAATFGGWFADRCREAGLSGCSAHGLRKVAMRRLAEAGATDQEMMSISGHKTRNEITRYSRGASQRLGASAAFAKLTKLSNPE